MNAKIAIAAIAAAMGLATAWWWATSPVDPPVGGVVQAVGGESATPTTTEPAAADRAASSTQRPPCAFVARETFGYDARWVTKTTLRPRALMMAVFGQVSRLASERSAVRETTEIAATWRLRLDVARVLPTGGAVLAARLDDLAIVNAAGAGGGGDGDGAGAGLNTAQIGDTKPVFLVQVGPRCAVERYGWSAKADRVGAPTQQSLLALSDFALPAPDDADAAAGKPYVGTGVDTHGTYHYRALLQRYKDRMAVLSRKLSAPAAANGVGVGATVRERVGGKGLQVGLQGGAWYRTAQLDEVRELGPPTDVLAHSDITLSSTLLAGRSPAIAVDLDGGDWIWGNLLGERNPTQPAIESKLVGIPMAAFLQKIADMVRGGNNLSESIDLLTAWMRANPGQVAALGAWLRANAATNHDNRHLAQVAMVALGKSGLAEARKALRDLALDPGFDGALRVDAAMNLATAKNFDQADMDAMLALSRERVQAAANDEVARTPAANGISLLGAAARQLREQGSDLADQAVAALRDTLANEQDPYLRKAAIIGIGNSGDAELLDVLKPFATSEDLALRLEAADALRLMPAADTAPFFAKWGRRGAGSQRQAGAGACDVVAVGRSASAA